MFAGLPTNPFGQPSKPSTASVEIDEDYDLKIRGLNKSFVESAQKLLERSPAADFSKLFQQYSKHLASFSVNLSNGEEKKPIIEPVSKAAFEPAKKFEFSKPAEKPTEKHFESPQSTNMPKFAELYRPIDLSKPVETSKPMEISKPFTFGTTAAKPVEFKPVPSISAVEVVKKEPEVIEVDKSNSESSSEGEAVTEAAPKFSFNFGSGPVIEKTVEKTTEKVTATATFAPFSFGSATATTSEPSKNFSFGSSTAPSQPTKPFSFGTTTAASEPTKPFSVGSSSEAFVFKPFSIGYSVTNTETTAPSAPDVASTESSNTPFKSFSFGSSVEAPKLDIVSATTTPASTDVPATAPVTAIAPAAASNIFSFGSDAPSSTFSFGATTETKQAESSAPKFSFGSSSIGGLAPLPTFSFGAPSSSNFSFNVPAAASSGKTGEQSDDGGDEIPAEEAESFSLTRTNTEQLKTGAGEENETSQHEQRCKVFMMDSTGSWIDLGVGIFKINRYNNESGRSRVLCRTEGNGKVILNALVSVPGMNVTSTEGKKEVALLAIGPESKLVKYLIRVKTLEQAEELKTAILNEIEYVKNGKNNN